MPTHTHTHTGPLGGVNASATPPRTASKAGGLLRSSDTEARGFKQGARKQEREESRSAWPEDNYLAPPTAQVPQATPSRDPVEKAPCGNPARAAALWQLSTRSSPGSLPPDGREFCSQPQTHCTATRASKLCALTEDSKAGPRGPRGARMRRRRAAPTVSMIMLSKKPNPMNGMDVRIKSFLSCTASLRVRTGDARKGICEALTVGCLVVSFSRATA